MRKNAPGYQIWTEDEITYLKRYYQERGSAFVAERLGRTTASVQHAGQKYATKVQDRGRKGGDRFMGPTEASLLCGIDPITIRRNARKDGVAREMAKGILIPESWVLKFRDFVQEWRTNEELGWYKANDVKRIFRISRSNNVTAKAWFAGFGTYGFAFVERVEMRLGRPIGRYLDGRYSRKLLFNPWDVEDLRRDVKARKPLLTDRCGLMLILIQEGYTPIWQRESPAGYHFDIDDTLSVGPFPQALSVWLHKAGALKWTHQNTKLSLTPLGEQVADEARNRGLWPVLGSAA